MGSKGEKKSGLVGEKSQTVYSANWKLDAILDKELGMLDTSKRRVEHRISMDQIVTKNRFEKKLHHSKVFHARMKGDREMLKRLITRDNFNFNTNCSSADAMNKRRDKDLEKKRIQHRISQEKMMTYRCPTPATAKEDRRTGFMSAKSQRTEFPEIRIASSPEADGEHDISGTGDVGWQDDGKIIRPMTAIKRITQAKMRDADKIPKPMRMRPVTAAATSITRYDARSSAVLFGIPPGSSTAVKSTRDRNSVNKRKSSVQNNSQKNDHQGKAPQGILIEVTSTADEDYAHVSGIDFESSQQNVKNDAISDGVGQTESAEDIHNPFGCNMNNNNGNLKPTMSSLRPSSAFETTTKCVPNLRPNTAHSRSLSKRPLSTSSEPTDTSRSRNYLTICEPVSSDQSDNESTVSTCRQRPKTTGRKKSSTKSGRKKNIFREEKKMTINDIDEARGKSAKHQNRINDYFKTIEGVKTDPDLIVDYYMVRLLEQSSVSASTKNVQRIRDMPDSDYDKDLSKRSIGDLKGSTITFRDVNRKYGDYKHDPYTPLHPTSLGFALMSRTSNVNAWQAENADSES